MTHATRIIRLCLAGHAALRLPAPPRERTYAEIMTSVERDHSLGLRPAPRVKAKTPCITDGELAGNLTF